jgi:hypothetical protein
MTLSFLKLYLSSKIEELDKRASVLHSVNDMSELAGKIELLQEMWNDLELDKIDKTETITFHNQI